MTFFNKKLEQIYKYIYIHDDQTILLQDMAMDLNICRITCRKYIKWLERRGLIKKTGKHFKIMQPD